MTESILEASKKARKRNFLGLFKRKSVIAILALALVGSGGWYYFKQKGEEQVATVAENKEWTVKKADLQIAIEGDGKVVSEDGVELSFSVNADTLEVDRVFVKEGDKIKKGDRIASVKTDDLAYDLEKAYASYQSTLASYNEKLAGAADKEITNAKSAIEQAELNLEQAKISLDKTKTNARNMIADAEQALADAKEDLAKNQNETTSEDVKGAYDNLRDTVKSTSISLESILLDSDKIIGVDNAGINDDFETNLGAEDISTYSAASISYIKAKESQGELNDSAVLLAENSQFGMIDLAVEKAQKALSDLEDHLYKMQKMLEKTVISVELNQSEIESFRSTVFSNRSAVNTKISALESDQNTLADAREKLDDYVAAEDDAEEALASAKEEADQDIANSEASLSAKEILLRNAKSDLADLMAPLSAAESASARSSLTSASISLDKARSDYGKAIMISPIDGEIAQLNYKSGDIILAKESDPVAIIINNDTLFVELDIEESDISKLSIGQSAVAIFDSLDELEIKGEVIFISQTAETSNNGIVTYLVRVVLKDAADSNIREGMSAAVRFIIAGVSDVLQVPVSAVRNVSNKPSVKLKNGEWMPVTTGFTDGKYVEILSGAKEGDLILY